MIVDARSKQGCEIATALPRRAESYVLEDRGMKPMNFAAKAPGYAGLMQAAQDLLEAKNDWNPTMAGSLICRRIGDMSGQKEVNGLGVL